ncbi:amino acid ABC transporter substrate-binding protein [Undibacterium sp. KW1]|uniref:substrate-binding periplasmic protein n=1 Tax=Undibacterium sp. KW1 TaxID=2058624 RepID=UPI001331E370|nr:transporter substrate-binding domain-containing protein [Undibacterium sp. KW1]BBB58934.1 amino acid ABC transporter substrate-binding protein [Undibacterium sp. KW1]
MSFQPVRTLATLLLCMLVTLETTAEETQLRFYTEEYPPVTFSQKGKPAGLGTEVVEEIMNRLGIRAPIEVVPWARGYAYATTTPNVGLFVTTRTPEREKLFKWVGPVSATTAHFYTRRDGQRFDTLEQARLAERILIPREWYLQQMLRGMGFNNINSVPTPVDAVRMLVAGRAPLMALDDVTLADTLSAAGINANDIVTGSTITQAVQYIAFSRDTPDSIAIRWQKTLDDMKADGSFERIYKKWLPGVTLPAAR